MHGIGNRMCFLEEGTKQRAVEAKCYSNHRRSPSMALDTEKGKCRRGPELQAINH